MTVMNEQKLQFRDMKPEDQLAIIKAKLTDTCEVWNGQWYPAFDDETVCLNSVYRTKPKQLVIPWEWVDKSIVGAAMDKYGDVYFYKSLPILDLHSGCYAGDWVYATAFNIDTNGVDWKTSYTPRPEDM
jgi:hypothetical protein